jgi:hypothetical protein
MAKQLSETELRRQAVQALSDSLGPVDALRFLALISREPFDYQEWRREYFSQFNVDELLEEVRKQHTSKVSWASGEKNHSSLDRLPPGLLPHFDVSGILETSKFPHNIKSINGSNEGSGRPAEIFNTAAFWWSLRVDPAPYHHRFATSSRREIAFVTDADDLVGQSESARDLGGAGKQGTDAHGFND